MSEQRPEMFVPALIGGSIAGLLTGIPFINCLCCLWIIGGAMLSVHLLIKNTPVPLSSGDGAIAGILSGAIAAVVDFIVSIPFDALSSKFFNEYFVEWISKYADDMPEGWESWFEGGSFGENLAWSLLGLLISLVIFAGLGALGGVLGISFFQKKKAPSTKE